MASDDMTRLVQLTTKVDAFFARVVARHGDDMQCGSGCYDCCRVRLTITEVEAEAIRAARPRVVANPNPELCAALDSRGRCQIYDVRPIVCRSHGAPVRIDGALTVCAHNFRATEPDPDCIIDQATLSTMVAAIDRADRPRTNNPRIELAALVDELARR